MLLADEPTGNLDDATAAGVLDLLDTLVRTSGHTLLIATHSQQVAAHCDRLVELHNGRLEPKRPADDSRKRIARVSPTCCDTRGSSRWRCSASAWAWP